MRNSTIERNTAETSVKLSLALKGADIAVNSGCGFLDHMLTLFAKHGNFSLVLECRGDTQVDYHHTTEDIGIALGEAFDKALGDRRGICRFGDTTLPMDESLVLTAADISGRPYLGFDVEIPAQKAGDFDTELVEEFFAAFVRSAKITLHIRKLAGKNSHHIIEAVFKSAARSLRRAVAIDPEAPDSVPSTKGVL